MNDGDRRAPVSLSRDKPVSQAAGKGRSLLELSHKVRDASDKWIEFKRYQGAHPTGN